MKAPAFLSILSGPRVSLSMEPGAVMNEDPGAGTAKIATAYIIWIVRIALPVIFFWIWYRTQPEKESWYSQPHEVSISRDEFMKLRKAIGVSAAPQSMANLTVMNESALPEAYRARPTTRAKRDNQPRRVEESRSSAPPASEHRDPVNNEEDGKAAGAKECPQAVVQRSSRSPPSEQHDPGSGADDGGAARARGEQPQNKKLADEDSRAQIQAVLNYVTFSHKERPQRIFLPDTGQPPPPPRKGADDNRASAKVNLDVQTALKWGHKLDFNLPVVSKLLYRQLSESRVHASGGTLSLMAEYCADAGDLRGASSFLMRMEENGHCPDTALLDKVMDLYTEEKDATAKTGAHANGPHDVPIPAEEEEKEFDGGPASHPWSSGAVAAPHPHTLNFSAYSDDENELSPQ